MSAKQIEERVAAECVARSEACERGMFAIGVHPVTGEPVAGLALVAPACIMFCMPLVPEQDIFIDYCLN